MMARMLARQRRLTDKYLGRELYRNPAWHILLDLYLAWDEGKDICVSSACGASGVPAATALRCLARLEKEGSVTRIPAHTDGRTVYVELTAATREKMTHLLTRLSLEGVQP
jgi:DNA-binding MarR family transcriptional regulator